MPHWRNSGCAGPKKSEPAEGRFVEQSVELFARNGQPALAWLTWRSACVLNLGFSQKEQTRWQTWCRDALGPDDAARLVAIVAANPLAGTASLPVPCDKADEAWSGDPGINPLLVVKIERDLAMTDALLATARPGSRYEAELRVARCYPLSDIGAYASMRREIDRGAAVLGEGDLRIKNLRALCAEGEHDFATANILFKEMLKDPHNTGARRNYAVSLFGAGDFRRALQQYKVYFKAAPEDVYMPIMADLSARRIGGREEKLLRDNIVRFAGNAWLHAGMRYLLGEITDDQLIAVAREGTVFDIIQHECEGWFWIAQVRLAAGDKSGGVLALRRCVSTGFTAFIEYEIAKVQLQRLEPAEKPAAPDERAPRNSRGVMVSRTSAGFGAEGLRSLGQGSAFVVWPSKVTELSFSRSPLTMS